MVESKVKVSKAEIEMLKNSARNGNTSGMAQSQITPEDPDLNAPPPPAKNEAKAATEALKARKPSEPPKPAEKAAEPPVEPPKEPPKSSELLKAHEPEIFTIPKPYMDELGVELDALKSKLGDNYTADMDDKIGKIINSDNLDKLVKGGFTAKQAMTQMTLMAQGFVTPDENTAAIQKKVKEVREAAEITPGPAKPAAEKEVNEKDLIREWKHGATRESKSAAFAKLLNIDEEVKIINKALGR
jgi:hypothetical protein